MTTAQTRTARNEAARAQKVGDALLDMLAATLMAQGGTVVIADVIVERARRPKGVYTVRLGTGTDNARLLITLDESVARAAEARGADPTKRSRTKAALSKLGLVAPRG